jgi:anaphase-promoting complex subunit 5
LLLIKVWLFEKIGRPEKGFTIAMRAASMAWRARLVPLLWQAIGALANILNALGEFGAAEQLLIAILPRCLETDVTHDVGMLYSLLADVRMGQAGEMTGLGEAAVGRAEMMGKVHKALDKAFECFSAVEDVDKRCEMMAKKAAIYRAEGDFERADKCADTYLGLWEEELAGKR